MRDFLALSAWLTFATALLGGGALALAAFCFDQMEQAGVCPADLDDDEVEVPASGLLLGEWGPAACGPYRWRPAAEPFANARWRCGR